MYSFIFSYLEYVLSFEKNQSVSKDTVFPLIIASNKGLPLISAAPIGIHI